MTRPFIRELRPTVIRVQPLVPCGMKGARRKHEETPWGTPTVHSIILRNLKFSVDTDELLGVVKEYVSPCFCTVARQGGLSKGYGFLSFDSPEQVEEAKKLLDGLSLLGRRMFVGNVDANGMDKYFKAARKKAEATVTDGVNDDQPEPKGIVEEVTPGMNERDYEQSPNEPAPIKEPDSENDVNRHDERARERQRDRFHGRNRERYIDRDRDRYRDRYDDRYRDRFDERYWDRLDAVYRDRYDERYRERVDERYRSRYDERYRDWERDREGHWSRGSAISSAYNMERYPPLRSDHYPELGDAYRSHRSDYYEGTETMRREIERQKYENMLLREKLERERLQLSLEAVRMESSRPAGDVARGFSSPIMSSDRPSSGNSDSLTDVQRPAQTTDQNFLKGYFEDDSE